MPSLFVLYICARSAKRSFTLLLKKKSQGKLGLGDKAQNPFTSVDSGINKTLS